MAVTDINSAVDVSKISAPINPVLIAQQMESAPVVTDQAAQSAPESAPVKIEKAPLPSKEEMKNDPSWFREDGTQKGAGFLGPLKFHNGDTSTEISIGVTIDGKETDIPTLVPTLTESEVQYLLNGGDPNQNEEIVRKATEHAIMRLNEGKSPFAEPGEAPQEWVK